jgi:hypothetical protein
VIRYALGGRGLMRLKARRDRVGGRTQCVPGLAILMRALVAGGPLRLILGLRSTIYLFHKPCATALYLYLRPVVRRARRAHHVGRRSSRVGSAVRLPCYRLESPGETKCDALPWGSC